MIISWLPILVGEIIASIRTGPFPSLETFPSRGMVSSLIVVLTCPHGVRRMRALLCAVSVINDFVVGVVRA